MHFCIIFAWHSKMDAVFSSTRNLIHPSKWITTRCVKFSLNRQRTLQLSIAWFIFVTVAVFLSYFYIFAIGTENLIEIFVTRVNLSMEFRPKSRCCALEVLFFVNVLFCGTCDQTSHEFADNARIHDLWDHYVNTHTHPLPLPLQIKHNVSIQKKFSDEKGKINIKHAFDYNTV